MRPTPECEVPHVPAMKVDHCSIRISRFIAARRGQRDFDLCARMGNDTTNLNVFFGMPEGGDRCEVPQHLLDCIRYQRGFGEKFGTMRWALSEEREHPSEHTGDCIQARHHQRPAKTDHLTARHWPIAHGSLDDSCKEVSGTFFGR